jgi:hypothetical protein
MVDPIVELRIISYFILVFFTLAHSIALMALGVHGIIRKRSHLDNNLLLIIFGVSLTVPLVIFLLNVSGLFGPVM